jgi:hypothetical protein
MMSEIPSSAEVEKQIDVEGRRSALKKLGLAAAYTAPLVIATTIPTKVAHASGSAPPPRLT